MSMTDSVEYMLAMAPPSVEWGVAVVSSEGEQLYSREADKPFRAASLGKLGIAHVLTHEGAELPMGFWERDLSVKAADKRPGTGLLQYFPDNYPVSAEEALRMMVRESDNTAARLLVQALGGAAVVNEQLAASPLQLTTTRLEVLEDGAFTFGKTTAAEAARLMMELSTSSVDDALHETTMWYGLSRDIGARLSPGTTLFNQYLRFAKGGGPVGVYERALSRSYRRAPFPHKNGSLDDVRHDTAVINGHGVAALSAGWDTKLPYGALHPAHTIHRRLGSTIAWHTAA